MMTTRLPTAALVLLILSGLAFWPDYLAHPATADSTTHVHAALGLAWLLLLTVQPLLVKARRLPVHRRAGRAGFVVGVAFVVSSVLLTHHRVSRLDADTFARDGAGFYLPLAMAALFAAALVLGLRWRHTPPLHGRYMACTLLALVDPVVSRLLYFWGPSLPLPALRQVPAFAVIVLTLVALTTTLPPRIAGRGTFALFAGAVVASLAFHFATPYTPQWLQWLAWFRGLPLT